MTDLEKAQDILASTNNGADLPEHQQHILISALRDDLGQVTASRLVFEDIYEQYREGPEKGN